MPWRRARPLRGRTCPSQPGGISRTRPVGINARSPGRSTISSASSGSAARRSSPALPGEAEAGSGRPRAAGSRWTLTRMGSSSVARLAGTAARTTTLPAARATADRKTAGLRVLAVRQARPLARQQELGDGAADPARAHLQGPDGVSTRTVHPLALVQQVLGEPPLVIMVLAVEEEERGLLALAVDALQGTDLDLSSLPGHAEAALLLAALAVLAALLLVVLALALALPFVAREGWIDLGGHHRSLDRDQGPLAVLGHRV